MENAQCGYRILIPMPSEVDCDEFRSSIMGKMQNALSRCTCKCDCGNTIEIGLAALKKKTSCGCDYLNPASDITGKKYNLGSYKTIEEAQKAREKAEKILFGSFLEHYEAYCERCGRPYIVKGVIQKYCDNCIGIIFCGTTGM